MKFDHEVNSSKDEKLEQLIVSHGMQGYGCFWFITEQLYANSKGTISVHGNNLLYLAKISNISIDDLESIIDRCVELKLWHYNNDNIYSVRVNKTKGKMADIREKRKEAGKASVRARSKPMDRNRIAELVGGMTDNKPQEVVALFNSEIVKNVDDLYESALNDRDFIAAIVGMGCPEYDIDNWLRQFTKEQRGDGNKQMSEREYRRYFRNWLGKKPYIVKSEINNSLTDEELINKQKNKYK